MLFLKRIGDDMKKIVLKQLAINSFILIMAFVIYIGVSYSIKNEENDNKDLLIKMGNMQVVLNTPTEKYEFTDMLKESLSDEMGIKQKGYDFSIINTGSIPIEYFEIRLVNQENKISNLPHKYLRFTISKDGESYSDVKNLGDVDSIIYAGYNLDLEKSVSFNLKMWLDESVINYHDLKLYDAMEVTLYQKFDLYDNYILYEDENSYNVPIRTSINSPISTVIPKRNGYTFLGWSSMKNGSVEYSSGSFYPEKKGKTLYPVWKKDE